MALHDYLVREIALDCAAGLLSRREALRRLVLLGLTTPAAGALLTACASAGEGTSPPSTDGTPSVATDPPTTEASSPAAVTGAPDPTAAADGDGDEAGPGTEIRFPGPRGELIGVLALAGEPRGAVLVIHENRGLTPHIATIPPRLAADGYTALAIDLLSEEGGTASLADEGAATAALGAAPEDRLIDDLRAGLDELARQAPGAPLAAIGFCFGGAMTWRLLAAGEPRLAAAVPFYGPAPEGADFAGSADAAVLGVYAELDDRVNASQEAARTALAAAGLEHEILVLPGVDHAFFNDTGPRYDAAAAAEAYQAMLDWFDLHLG